MEDVSLFQKETSMGLVPVTEDRAPKIILKNQGQDKLDYADLLAPGQEVEAGVAVVNVRKQQKGVEKLDMSADVNHLNKIIDDPKPVTWSGAEVQKVEAVRYAPEGEPKAEILPNADEETQYAETVAPRKLKPNEFSKTSKDAPGRNVQEELEFAKAKTGCDGIIIESLKFTAISLKRITAILLEVQWSKLPPVDAEGKDAVLQEIMKRYSFEANKLFYKEKYQAKDTALDFPTKAKDSVADVSVKVKDSVADTAKEKAEQAKQTKMILKHQGQESEILDAPAVEILERIPPVEEKLKGKNNAQLKAEICDTDQTNDHQTNDQSIDPQEEKADVDALQAVGDRNFPTDETLNPKHEVLQTMESDGEGKVMRVPAAAIILAELMLMRGEEVTVKLESLPEGIPEDALACILQNLETPESRMGIAEIELSMQEKQIYSAQHQQNTSRIMQAHFYSFAMMGATEMKRALISEDLNLIHEGVLRICLAQMELLQSTFAMKHLQTAQKYSNRTLADAFNAGNETLMHGMCEVLAVLKIAGTIAHIRPRLKIPRLKTPCREKEQTHIHVATNFDDAAYMGNYKNDKRFVLIAGNSCHDEGPYLLGNIYTQLCAVSG